jgi:exonuclease SbcC
MNERTQAQTVLSELQGASVALDAAHRKDERARAALREAEDRNQDRRGRVAGLVAEVEARKARVTELDAAVPPLPDGQSADQWEAALLEKLDGALAGERRTRSALDLARDKAAEARAAAQARARQLDESGAELTEAELALRVSLAQVGLDGEAELDLVILGDDERRSLTRELAAVREARIEALALAKRAQFTWDVHLSQKPDDLGERDSLEEAAKSLEGQEREWAEHSGQLGVVQEKLAEQARHEARADEERARQDDARKELALWDDLHALVGKGDRFKEFAQSLNLRELADLANVRLSRLAPRFQLVVATGDDGLPTLGFAVSDAHLAGAERPLTTLSGGETFLVSLALALGLADCRTSGMPIETLLLDEGLGTLDQETLEVAMGALEALRGPETQIGIITHVEGMKRRIPSRIEVVPLGGGRSKLVLHGILDRPFANSG